MWPWTLQDRLSLAAEAIRELQSDNQSLHDALDELANQLRTATDEIQILNRAIAQSPPKSSRQFRGAWKLSPRLERALEDRLAEAPPRMR